MSFQSFKISIITVTYNAEKYIEDTISSILNQTYTSFESIIIDGASSDNTIKIVQKLGSSKITLYSEPDNGLYDAMNKGINKARGEYILFLNAGDTFYNANTLEEIFNKSNNEDFIYGDVLVMYNDLTRPYHKTKPNQNVISYRSFVDGMVICHQAMIVKKHLAATFQNDKYKISGDIDWSIRTLKNCTTFLDTQQVISLFLDGGVSQTNKFTALKERFFISISHFGLLHTIFAHIGILIKRSIKINLIFIII